MRRRTRGGDRKLPASPNSGAAGTAGTCEHLAAATRSADPEPLTPGRCGQCAAHGEDHWAHLRMCLTCGHVGCCDSSPHQHATAHHRLTGHPVMRSVEPGESWRWCYVDLQVDATAG